MSKWCAASNLVLNLDKRKIIEFVTNNSSQSAFGIGYTENYIEETANKKNPCFKNNNQVMWINQSGQTDELSVRLSM
jgi:hypothetical protein